MRERYEVTIQGTQPLLLHNGRLANPLDPFTKALKEITGKRKKTDEDYEEAAYREFLGGLYHDDDLGPYIPGENIEAMIREGAKVHSRGKDVQSGVMADGARFPLEYDGPKETDKLYAKGFFDVRRCKIKGSAIMRCRPRFNRWSLSFSVFSNAELMNGEDLKRAITDAGKQKGFCDFRPRYGQFQITRFERSDG